MSNFNRQDSAYGLSQAILNVAPVPIQAKRAPTSNDINYQIGQLWIYSAANSAYILTSVLAGASTWEAVSGGGGSFSSLTVTPGPISLTGTTSINITGAGVTTIGTGGTGAVNIGNATGNTAVTGSLTASAGLVATAGGLTVTGTTAINDSGAAATNIGITPGTGTVSIGNATGNVATGGTLTSASTITATAGNIVSNAGSVTAFTKFILGAGPTIIAGAGSPSGTVTAPQGSLYLNTTGSTSATRAYINTDAGTTWTAVTTVG